MPSCSGPAGYAYVYRSYGIHWCLNFVCEGEGSASAVLIRALQPVTGLATMRRRRGMSDERRLCAGPGRLCEALAVTHAHNGLRLDRAPFALYARAGAVESRDPARESAFPRRSNVPGATGWPGRRS